LTLTNYSAYHKKLRRVQIHLQVLLVRDEWFIRRANRSDVKFARQPVSRVSARAGRDRAPPARRERGRVAILYLAPATAQRPVEGQSRARSSPRMREALGVPRTVRSVCGVVRRMLQATSATRSHRLPVLPELARVGVYTLT